jgi:hypothetical protein
MLGQSEPFLGLMDRCWEAKVLFSRDRKPSCFLYIETTSIQNKAKWHLKKQREDREEER